MIGTLLRRLALSIPLLIVVTVLTFIVTGLTPGSVAATILGTNATPAKIAALSQQLGLNEPTFAHRVRPPQARAGRGRVRLPRQRRRLGSLR